MRRAPLRKMLGLVLVSVCAKVAAAAAPPTERVAVVFVGKDSKDPAAVAFTQALFNLGDRSPQLTLIGEKGLTKSLRGDPVTLFTKCGARLGCITKLSRKAKAQAVLFGKWGHGEGNGPLTLQYLLITVQSQKIRQKGVMTLAAGTDATRAATDNFQAMLGIKAPAPLPGAAAPVTPPEPEVAAPPSPAAPPPPTPGAAPSPPEAPVPAAPPSAAPAPSTAAAPQNVSVVAPHPTPALFITSLAVMGVGVVTLGTGAALVLDAHHQADGVNTNSPTGTPPAQALSTINSANSKIRTGNLLMEVGGGVTAVGGVLLLLDRLNVFGTNADSHVAWQVDPGRGAFAWSWKQAF